MKYVFILWIAFVFSGHAFAADFQDKDIDHIYQLFTGERIELDKVELHYHPDVIHVGESNAGLLQGKEAFIAKNIMPTKHMLESGQFELSLKFFLVKRFISDRMANDVGYLYSKVTTPDGETMEQVQKYSWVFVQQNGVWQVISDFDRTMASLSDLKDAIHTGARLIE